MNGKDELELAWACGLFEGEGHIHCKVGTKGYFERHVVLNTTDLDVLERFQRALGFGQILGPYQPKQAHHKPMYRWRACGWEEQKRAVELMYHMLGERRRAQADLLLANPAQTHGGYRYGSGQRRQTPIPQDQLPAWARR